MKSRLLLSLAVAVLASSAPAFAQKKDPNPKKFERAEARKIPPEVRTFVTPQIFDMKMLSNSRETFGPYYFPLDQAIGNITMGEIRNDEMRALSTVRVRKLTRTPSSSRCLIPMSMRKTQRCS